MQGLNLIHVGFLAAALVVVLPIIIHLLFRQRARTVQVGTLRFLLQVVRENRRRQRIQQWMLLSLRMLAVLLLALLFGRPYWDQSQFRGLDQEVVLIVDRSASMHARDSAGETSFDRAIVSAKRELSQLDDNVIVHVAVSDAAGVMEIPPDQLWQTVPTQAATDLGLAYSWARDLVAASGRATRKIVMITDLQQSGLPRTPMQQLPEGVDFAIRDVGDSLIQNVAIESVESLSTEIHPERQVSVRIVLRNHGPIPVRNLTATCEVEHVSGVRFSGERQVDISGHGNVVVAFPLAITTDGLYKGRVAINSADALAFDNERWIAFEARHPDRVLLIDGQSGSFNFDNETYFLETALRLQTEEIEGKMRSFEVERIAWEASKEIPPLDGFRSVVLANVRSLSARDGEQLNAYVRQGGSLLIFAGDQVSKESLSELQKQRVLPGIIGDASMLGRLRVDRWDAEHTMLACFSDPQHGDLRRLEFREVLPLNSLEPDSRVLLSAGDVIVAAERHVEKGRCLYFGSTADRDWTELPRMSLYVPLMRRLLAYLTGQLEERPATINAVVSKPNETAGITPIDGDDGHWIVRNIDPRESALEQVTPEALAKLAGVELKESMDDKFAAAGLTLPRDSLRPDEIWTIVVWLLFAVLAAEMLLAGRVP